jgi:nucleoside-diphosphate-sugar epimerase
MTSAIRRVAGAPKLPVKSLPWTLLAMMAPFNETLRELVEMKPLWRAHIRLDNRKLVAFLGEEPRTPLDVAVRATMEGLQVPLGEVGAPIGLARAV